MPEQFPAPRTVAAVAELTRSQHDAVTAPGAKLGRGPLTVVQPIGVVAIGLTALPDRRFRDLPAILPTMAGVGAFVSLVSLVSGSATATRIVPDAELTAGCVSVLVRAVSSRCSRAALGSRARRPCSVPC
ncbi:hypothetical protein ACRAKJ_09095 [Saccharothrix sp. DSM 118769]